jgi:RNA polymerase sigma-70 factor (family 1)
MKLQDKQILEKLRKGEKSGFKEMFDLYYKPLCIFSLKYLDSIDQAEDIVQDTFVRFWNKKSYVTIKGELRSYLFVAVKNNSLNFIKKNAKYRFVEIEEQALSLVEDNIDDEELKILKAKLYKEIEALPVKGKEIFKSIVLNNLKHKEVAELYGISVNTVKTHYSRALLKLRNSLDILVLILLH